MKRLKQFSIPFTGLKLGKHQFNFEIDKSFFDAFEYSLVKEGKLKARIELDKQETMLILNFHLEGSIKLTCDKCLADFDQPISLDEKQIVKFAEEGEEYDDVEIIVLPRKQTAINISVPIYEMISVSVPYINKCEQVSKTCNEQMLAALAKLSGNIAKKNKQEQNGDSCWDVLKQLK